ncbi:transcriptional regulator [Aurantiacibacter atlanticus]|uniref:Transcriptional regulator n=1 Tax=Aurantiacibacter atlanticus TaxID=1648404 RepID=A0A0H4W1K6_9SPHN|nr:transcriptional regulator [Aurantiacibacter atlanticus]
MTDMTRSIRTRSTSARRTFPATSRDSFKLSYPEGAHKLEHRLMSHPLLDLDALAMLGEVLPADKVEYNRGDVPIGVDGKPEGNGLTIGETIHSIATSNSWAVLKNIEKIAPYAALLKDLLEEIRPVVEPRTGKMMDMQGFVFISSPHAVTPYHFDPEHNILMQLRGRKTMTVYPAGDSCFAPDQSHEAYHTGGARELRWDDAFSSNGHRFNLYRGDAIYVPVMAPHHVRNGKEVSISLSVTWRSEWSFAEADARALNNMLRRWGLKPRAPGRWPARNRIKATAMRIARKIPGLA